MVSKVLLHGLDIIPGAQRGNGVGMPKEMAFAVAVAPIPPAGLWGLFKGPGKRYRLRGLCADNFPGNADPSLQGNVLRPVIRDDA